MTASNTASIFVNHKIELWEAIVTFIFFPVLVILAYAAEKNFFLARKATEMEPTFGGIAMDGKVTEETRPLKPKLDEEDEIFVMAKELGREEDMTEQEAARIVANKILVERPHDRAWHRINATRGLTGGRKLVPKVLKTFEDLYDKVQGPGDELEERASAIVPVDHSEGGRHPVVEFTASALAVMENEGKVRVGSQTARQTQLSRQSPVRSSVETINGTAVAGEDYKPINEVVTFAPNETLRQVYIDIVDDFEWEPDEVFFVRLQTESDDEVRLGNTSICQITIINDDEPGVLAFPKPGFIMKESGLAALVPVVRTGGADGHVSVRWRTGDITAVSGKDYSGGEGELFFDNQETTKVIEIPLFETNKKERDDSFQIELMDAGGGATIGKLNKCIVTIVSDAEYTGLVSRIVNQAKANLDPLQLENSTYAQQFYEAMNVNGGDVETASLFDYVMHFLTFYWKIMFAFIPPTQYFGGWPTFVVSLAIIGFLTAIIGDLASIFGCVIGLPDAITAITFVALGTSMPDTFASKSAAMLEKTADNSVGNVNGSNSVNVFLGLGLPWLIAAIYWKVQNRNCAPASKLRLSPLSLLAVTQGSDFDVPAGSLGFSVILYTITAVIAIAILMLRRFFVGAELGGPSIPKYVSGAVLIVLWFLYVLFSSLQTTGVIDILFRS
ncbi:hypothetical protein C0Q70_00905 [Pomacea canaliculata]|uniref:Calx-beta domain-containing protein n=1 Tax=Pomacea canaliculata TaxID=400727 RepID=A0A2T7PXZ7_POMCA|nr:hypothetical protein C0Q70_00905 [Pomacea canaliculata]